MSEGYLPGARHPSMELTIERAYKVVEEGRDRKYTSFDEVLADLMGEIRLFVRDLTRQVPTSAAHFIVLMQRRTARTGEDLEAKVASLVALFDRFEARFRQWVFRQLARGLTDRRLQTQ
jgi:hypothetical protein